MKLKKTFLTAIVSFAALAASAYGSVLTMTPRLTVEHSYTDNASLTENNTQSDYVTTISPSVNMELSEKHMGAELFYDYQHELYWDNTANNSSRHSAGLAGWADLSKRTKLTIGERFTRIEDPLREQDRILLPDEDPYLIRDSLVRRSRDPYYTYNSNVDLSHQFGENDFLNLNYFFSVREDKAADGNSYKRHTPGIGVTYWMTPQYGIDTTLDYTKARFDDNDKSGTTNLDNFEPSEDFDDINANLKLSRKITKHFSMFVSYNHIFRDFQDDTQDVTDVQGNNQGIDSDYQIYSPSAGFSYEIDKDTSLSLGAGYFYQNIKDDPSESGFFANTSLTKNWKFQRGSFRLAGSSGIDRNDFGSQSRGFERFYDLIGKLTYEFTRHFGGNLGTGLRRNEFINNKNTATNSNNDETEDRVIFDAGLHYRPKRWISVSTNYTHSLLYSDNKNNLRRPTPDPGGDESGTADDNSRFHIGVTLSPKEWVFIGINYSHSRLNSELSDGNNEENRASISVTLVPERPFRYVY